MNIAELVNKLLFRAVGFGLGLFPIALFSQSALSAERITTYVGPVQVSITVDQLEEFAATGEASGHLNLLLSVLDEETEAQLQKVLNLPVQTGPEAIAPHPLMHFAA